MAESLFQKKPAKILLVEDDIDSRNYITRLLENQSYKVNHAYTGEEATDRALTIQPDLVLLDIQLPGIDGFEVCEKLKSEPEMRDIPVIFLTGMTDKENLIRGLRIGAVDYITKPFHSLELTARVKTHIDLRQKTLQLIDLVERDSLTRLGNRRKLTETLNNEWRRCQREEKPISLIILDIDNFKAYNDTYGHLKGDECLRKLARVLSRSIRRPTDLAARYGGEEFVIVLGNTSKEGVKTVASTIQRNIADMNIEHKSSGVAPYVTCSAGAVTVLPSKTFSTQDLLLAADQNLYQAKANGKNQVVFSQLTE